MKRKYVWHIEYQPIAKESDISGFPMAVFPCANIKSHLSNTDENRERVIKNFIRSFKRKNPNYEIWVWLARYLGEVDENGIWVL